MSGVWLLEELRIIPVSFCLLQAVFVESKENSGHKSLLDTGVCCSSYFFSPGVHAIVGIKEGYSYLEGVASPPRLSSVLHNT